MTREEIISGLQMTMGLIQFDPSTGNVRPIYTLNDLDKTTYVACKAAIEALKAQADLQSTCNQLATDTISRKAAIDAILAVTGNSSVRELYEHVQEHGLSDMWSGGVNAAIDIIIALPSAQPEIIMCKDCIHIHDNDCPIDWGKTDYDFCSYAERRADGFD